MRKIPDSLVARLEEQVPDFCRMIRTAKEGEPVLMTLDAFASEPELLYNVLWFATTHGNSVTIVSPGIVSESGEAVK